MLESRHAFEPEIDIALNLIKIYFGADWHKIIDHRQNWWNIYRYNKGGGETLSDDEGKKDDVALQKFTGIMGKAEILFPGCKNEVNNSNIEEISQNSKVKQAFNDWVINLAKVGFYLTEGE